jgi:hypothetical protein
MNFEKTMETDDGARYLISVTSDKGEDLYPGGRFVDAEDWDSDCKAVCAEIAKYLADTPKSVTVIEYKSKEVVTMDTPEIVAKLADIAAKQQEAINDRERSEEAGDGSRTDFSRS